MTSRKNDIESLYEAAVKALARRARSSMEIRLLLERRGAGERDIGEVLRRLRENGYLDDARFGRYFASARLENDLHGSVRVRRDLKARGLKEEIAEKAVASAYAGVDEVGLLRQYIRRKMNVSRAFSKPSAVVSLHRRLLRAGFSSDTIVPELKRMLRSASGRVSPSTMDAASWEELLDSLSEISETEAELDE